MIPMTLILARDREHGIGYDGDMLFKISEDLQRFKRITWGGILVMGRKTFESLPEGALPGRVNLVLTRNPDYDVPGAVVLHGEEELEETLQKLLREKERPVFLIGGANLVTTLLSRVNRAHITEVDQVFPMRDTVIPDLLEEGFYKSEVGDWRKDPDTGLSYRYVDYERNIL